MLAWEVVVVVVFRVAQEARRSWSLWTAADANYSISSLLYCRPPRYVIAEQLPRIRPVTSACMVMAASRLETVRLSTSSQPKAKGPIQVHVQCDLKGFISFVCATLKRFHRLPDSRATSLK